MSEEKNIEIEQETEIETSEEITNPFSIKDIAINNRTIVIPSLINKLKHNEIDLNPEFQRNDNLWDRTRMSRLIESILLKLPLPIFYFDVSNPEKWIVVDGLQRLSTIKKFMVDKKLKLHNLEFLGEELNGKGYNDLDRKYKRTIEDTQLITYQIEAQTPKKVRYSIFHRINTGGLTLNAQEIRQALNQDGNAISFLKGLTENEIFKKIVGVSSKRMLDRELALRYVAFRISEKETFTFNNMGEFLDEAMEKLNNIKDIDRLDNLKNSLLDTLKFSEEILGKNHRFSRSIVDDKKSKTLNRSLFDVVTVCFSEIEDKDKFLGKKDIFLDKFKILLKDEQSSFTKAITEGTSGKGAIETRFKVMRELIKEILDED